MEFSLCLFTFSKVTFCCIVFFSARTPPAPGCGFILFFNLFNKLTVHTPAVYDNGKIKNNYLKFLMVLRTGSGRFVLFEVGYRAFSHDVTAAILVFQNNGTAAMLVYLDNPVGVEFFSYVKTFFCCNKLA